MEEIYKKGMILSLQEGSEDKYIVIENLKLEDKLYLLLTDFEGKIEKDSVKDLKIDYTKMFMVCFDEKTGDVNYDHNEEIAKMLVEKSLKAD